MTKTIASRIPRIAALPHRVLLVHRLGFGPGPFAPFASWLDAIAYQEAELALRYSVSGRIGTALESVSRLAGLDWRTNIALVGGFAAKEVVVSTLGTAYSLGEVDPEETMVLSEALAKDSGWSPLAALGLIVFTMFYSPCFVSVVCISREAGSWKWGAFAIVFNTLLAFGLAVLIYQVGSLIFS